MKVLLMGAAGGMGTRYKAILNMLGIDFSPYDTKFFNSLEDQAKGCDRVLIATPTSTHAECIKQVIEILPGKPILCEKPICKNIDELESLIGKCENAQSDLRMIYQYREIVGTVAPKLPSHYNYFKTGNDGLIWDCIQIIGLANDRVTLNNTSPIWDCMINGQALNIAYMDAAYISNVSNWLMNPKSCLGVDEIYRVHIKTARFTNGAA